MRGFCGDIAKCMQNFAEDIDTLRDSRRHCHQNATGHYLECLDHCEPSDGPLCPESCDSMRHADLARCDANYLKGITAIELELRSCMKSAEANNSAIHPGCECPEGMTPFPDQGDPKWDDLPCRP